MKTNEQRRFVKKICGIIENLIEGDNRNMLFSLLSDQIEKCIESEISIRPAYNLAVSILKVLNTCPSAQRVIEHNQLGSHRRVAMAQRSWSDTNLALARCHKHIQPQLVPQCALQVRKIDLHATTMALH